jgi:hypothetical protein
MRFAQCDVVKIKAILKEVRFKPDGVNRRVPRVGDVATITEVYSVPAGYELECSDANASLSGCWPFDRTRLNWRPSHE